MQKELLMQGEFTLLLEQIREELDDHRDAVNINSQEIECNHELIYQMMAQMDKLSERIDSIALYLHKKDRSFVDDNIVTIKPLTKREKQVFAALYEINQSNPAVSYRDLAKRLNMPISLVSSYITALIEKGVPLDKQYANRMAYISLKPSFQRLQAKSNIMGMDAKLTSWM